MVLEVNFPIECLEDIFLHLNDKDLIKCTLVCPTWNEFIGWTSSCMDKIKLKCRSYDLTQGRNQNIFMNSKRKYKHLNLCENYSKKLCQVLLAKGCNWTHVTIDLNFRNSNNFLDFLVIFQSTVQELCLWGRVYEEEESQGKATVELSDLQFP